MTVSIENAARDMVGREVRVCLSYLVSTLAKGYGEVSRGDLGDMVERAFELCSPIQDWEEAATQAGWTKTPEGRFWRNPTEDELAVEDDRLEMFLGSGPFIFSDELAETICNDEGIEPYDREVYEHWAVSEWFGEKLRDAGEKVDFDFGGMVVWARTTTGQAIYADYVVENIAKALHAA